MLKIGHVNQREYCTLIHSTTNCRTKLLNDFNFSKIMSTISKAFEKVNYSVE